MTRTAEFPAGRSLSDILRKAARVEPQPERLRSSARFLFYAIAQNLFACLKIPEPSRRRFAPCFALGDLPRRCVRRALKLFADVGQGRTPVPFRNALPGAPFPRPMPNLLPCSVSRGHPRVARDARDHAIAITRWGCADVCGFGVALINLVCREGIRSGIRGSSRNRPWGPHPRSRCRSAAVRVSRAPWGVRIEYGSVRLLHGLPRHRKATPSRPGNA